MKTLPIFIAIAALSALLAPPSDGQTRFATLSTFTNGAPVGLTLANGVLYGVFEGPVPANCGSVFELQPPAAPGVAWTETVLYSFATTNDACDPTVAPVVAPNGTLYGLTDFGGLYDWGALYELKPPASPGGSWTERVLYSFGPGNASNLIPGPNDSFYLLSGDLVQLQAPTTPGGLWTQTVLYNFPAGAPPNSLTRGAQGVFYGTTSYGGSAPGQLGEVFQLTAPSAPGGAWTETVLHNFGYGDGYAGNPNSLTVASDGTIYGTTYGADSSGARGLAWIFELAPPASPGGSWTYTVLKNLRGNHPDQPLVVRNGNLFGAIATPQGGAVFELQPPSAPGGAWTSTYLHVFTNGQTPWIALIDERGTIFGTTQTMNPLPPTGTVYRIATQ